ncbi:MAG: LLM class flavin-dependent oxidoreductase [Pigmentiphaga sp.]|uniref:LLM class flavin-dependent oxidoreductase n=1 Tax=Pigmentiphaga sp. TaxID=1977564 RepID=UPI0029AF7FDA|nr:LLM class flavin-dependent oxidoreductase [Pigmentiphaga sp.]MDX3907279.1 LLM class flavin-dependent oxidoreductase [Pigmentiphaga sp.]
MKILNFSLMPYRPLDIPASKQYRSVWVALPNSFFDPEKGAYEYESYIDLLAQSEDLGFDGICVNEHHQTAYGLMPAPNLIASALIQRTKKVKIAILGRALPLVSNPLTIAEEFSMLDCMSRGRIIAGFVRGIGAEYHSSLVNPTQSHERFHEAHDLIIRAWTETGPFSWSGEHYELKYVNPWPRPYQQPHPPIWVPSQGSLETIEWAADPRRKYPLLVTFSSRDTVIKNLLAYRKQAKDFGYDPAPGQLGWAAPVYVAETDEQAIAQARAGMEALFNDYLNLTAEMLLPPGYSSAASMRKIMEAKRAIGRTGFGQGTGRQSIEKLIDQGTAIVGSPRTVIEKIRGVHGETGLGNFVAMLQFGTLPNELARKNQELFAQEVMPALRAM